MAWCVMKFCPLIPCMVLGWFWFDGIYVGFVETFCIYQLKSKILTLDYYFNLVHFIYCLYIFDGLLLIWCVLFSFCVPVFLYLNALISQGSFFSLIDMSTQECWKHWFLVEDISLCTCHIWINQGCRVPIWENVWKKI